MHKVTKTCGQGVHKLWTSWVQTRGLYSSTPSLPAGMRISIAPSEHLFRVVSPYFPTSLLPIFTLLSHQFSTFSTVPIRASTRYTHNILDIGGAV